MVSPETVASPYLPFSRTKRRKFEISCHPLCALTGQPPTRRSVTTLIAGNPPSVLVFPASPIRGFKTLAARCSAGQEAGVQGASKPLLRTAISGARPFTPPRRDGLVSILQIVSQVSCAIFDWRSSCAQPSRVGSSTQPFFSTAEIGLSLSSRLLFSSPVFFWRSRPWQIFLIFRSACALNNDRFSARGICLWSRLEITVIRRRRFRVAACEPAPGVLIFGRAGAGVLGTGRAHFIAPLPRRLTPGGFSARSLCATLAGFAGRESERLGALLAKPLARSPFSNRDEFGWRSSFSFFPSV